MKKGRNRHLFCLLLCMAGMTFAASRASAIPIFGASGLGRAGTGVAADNMQEVYTTNPSTMMYSQHYSVGGGFASDGNTLQTSVIDTKTSSIGAGLSYFHQLNEARYGDSQWKIRGVHLALGGMVSEGFALALMGKFFWYHSMTHQVANTNRFNLDAGATYRINQSFSLGATVRNFLHNYYLETVPITDLAFGAAFKATEQITLLADVGTWWHDGIVKSKWQFSGAVDARVSKAFSVRAGYKTIAGISKYQGAAAGFSLYFDTVRLSYGGMLYIAARPVEHQHSVDLTLVF